MADWIAFDEATAARLSSRTAAPVKLAAGDALETALASDGPCLLLAPGPDGRVEVLTIRRPASAPKRTLIATGFLGLQDAEEEEEQTPPSSWWQRLWK